MTVIMLFLVTLCLLSSFLVQCREQPFSSSQMKACMEKIGVEQLELINFFRNKPQDPPEKMMCLFKCEMEETGLIDRDGKLDKSKWPSLNCLNDIEFIKNCTEVQKFRACVVPHT